MIGCLIVDQKHAKNVKNLLEGTNTLHKGYRITKINEAVAIPFTFEHTQTDENVNNLKNAPFPYSIKYLNEEQLLPSKAVPPQQELKSFILKYLSCEKGLTEDVITTLLTELPAKWDMHDDLVMFPDTSFKSDIWHNLQNTFWEGIARIMNVKRIALKSRIQKDDFRTPQVKMVLGDDFMVNHIDNGIRYTFDITKNMFCKGNITEKLRIASWNCENEVVLDMFAGIGYFTLPYLVKARAKKVTAIEWNPVAVKILQKNLALNNVEDRCHVIYGDNRDVTPKNFADRVNLGLIPTSTSSWKAACEALNTTSGGWLHIHENIECTARTEGSIKKVNFDSERNESTGRASILDEKETKCYCLHEDNCIINRTYKKNLNNLKKGIWCSFVNETLVTLTKYFEDFSHKQWVINVRHIEYLKSYAPRIDNLVFDIECRPL